MKIKEVTVSAVIPTAQYANITPAITVEVDDDIEQAKALAMQHIVGISQKYAEAGKALPSMKATANAKRIECLVGGSVLYDDVAHVYTNEQGDVYLSGSAYAKQFDKPFDINVIAQKMADKTGVDVGDIIDIWKLKGSASASFGTAVHEALEMYGKYKETSEKLAKEYHISAIPIIKDVVEGFFRGREKETALYEPMVVDHDRKWAGQIDRLVVTGDKKCIVGDYKTNVDLTPAKVETYWNQLSFYASILKAGGWTVEGLEIYHYDGSKWVIKKSEVKEIK